MASLRAGCAIAVFSTVVGGCASTYAPNELPPPRDFSVDDMAVGGTGGNGSDDLAGAGGGDLAAADLAAADLSTVHDLAQGCVDDGDGGVVPTLWMAAPTASGLFAARLRGGT